MRKFTYFIVLILATSLLMSSCKKDEKDEKNKNEFTFDGSTVSLDNGFIRDRGTNLDGSYDFDVHLVTENITHVGNGDFNGIGEKIYLDLNTTDDTGLEAGTYVWSEDRTIFTIVKANIVLETGEKILFTNGSVDISFDGDQTILEFDLITEGNKTLNGYFKGTLTRI